MSDQKLILCIDDEKIVLDSLKAQLTEVFGSEFELEFAESADEGMEVIDEAVDDGIKVLLIVSDWLMPGMKGDEFLINVHKLYPGIVKILLTGQADDAAIERAKTEADLHALLAKPWEKEVLLDAIKKGLEKIND